MSPGRRRWSLQARLMVTVMGMVALILVGSAVAIGARVGDALIGSLDSTLDASTAALRLFEPGPGELRGVRDAAAVLSTGRQPEGYLLLLDSTAGVTAAVVTADSGVTALSAEQVAAVVATPDNGFATITVPDLGTYRVVPFRAGDVAGIAGLPLGTVNATITQILWAILLVTALGLVLLAAAIAVVLRRSLKPLEAVADTATRVAALPMAEGAVSIAERVPVAEADARTEIGRVGIALNTLLDHVGSSLDARQRNEERMRAFVADASHELRTPLASIRGYSELSLRALQQLPGPEAATTTTSALERIQAQSVRMTSLVEDLLLLARLDEGQELVFGAVDLTRLAIEAVADARAVGTDHEWILDVGDEPVVAAGDVARLHQVVANLLANARVHTPAGTRVTVAVLVVGGEAVVRVNDNGPGIEKAVAGELFERFSRGDRSRARQTGGTGLGLSIARAIVVAHHGSLTVDSRPGSTTFELRLPARPADPAP
ncbi:sensor histidine kinase [Microbacterium sp.]|uniref:sensor histidine kinase n=1 Tax=Microbacterium sp. TaxID=51671 RepID=UPI0039E2845A